MATGILLYPFQTGYTHYRMTKAVSAEMMNLNMQNFHLKATKIKIKLKVAIILNYYHTDNV